MILQVDGYYLDVHEIEFISPVIGEGAVGMYTIHFRSGKDITVKNKSSMPHKDMVALWKSSQETQD